MYFPSEGIWCWAALPGESRVAAALTTVGNGSFVMVQGWSVEGFMLPDTQQLVVANLPAGEHPSGRAATTSK